jgi:Fic family protein
MNTPITLTPFTTSFLSQFTFTPSAIPISDKDIKTKDSDLSRSQRLFLNPDIEKSLISKNELLASFAISKAENSQLTLTEAEAVYNLVTSDKKFNFVGNKLQSGKPLSPKDHDRLEFFDIAKTFRELSSISTRLEFLTLDFILGLHKRLTEGLDIFAKSLPDFEPYKSGDWRRCDDIRVGTYTPAPFDEIQAGLEELIAWIKADPTPTNIAIFHTAFYALHPFNNGNKRVSRILEHLLWRSIGLNSANLYSTSYYYHIEKDRYYKYLLYSLTHTNFNHFTSFILESLIYSMIGVIKTTLEVKRREFVNLSTNIPTERKFLTPLIKHYELQFKHFARANRSKMARQTLVNMLTSLTEKSIIIRREDGKKVYYSLNLILPESNILSTWIQEAKIKISYLPKSFWNIIPA